MDTLTPDSIVVAKEVFNQLEQRIGITSWLADGGNACGPADDIFDFVSAKSKFPRTLSEALVFSRVDETVVEMVLRFNGGLVRRQPHSPVLKRIDIIASQNLDPVYFSVEMTPRAAARSADDGVEKAIAKLVKQLRWVAPLRSTTPFVPALAVGWPRAQFVALRPVTDEGDVEATRVGKLLDLTELSDRVVLVGCAAKVARDIASFPKPLYKPLQYFTGKMNTFFADFESGPRSAEVLKKYHPAYMIGVGEEEWVGLYKRLMSVRVPNLVRVEHVGKELDCPTVWLAPVGWAPKDPTPTTATDAKAALCAVAAALAGLHACVMVHRDLRWCNVVRTATGGWLLVDLDNVAELKGGSCAWPKRLPKAQQIRAEPSWESPQGRDRTGGDKSDRWTAQHDLWQLARMARSVKKLDEGWFKRAFDALCDGRADDVAAMA
jgi:hypothetical protein